MKLPDDQCSSMTKGSIYYINHMYIQPFTAVVDQPEIGCLMEVSTTFLFADTAFLLGTTEISYTINRLYIIQAII